MSHFEIIPAIDILGGKVVRLWKGDYQKSQVFSENPLEVLRAFLGAGGQRLHIVDLDAARTGQLVNFSLIKKIIKNCPVPVQVGGGIRTINALKKILAAGADRAIVGTAAFLNPQFLKEALRLFGPKIVVSIDAFGDKIAVKGWVEKTQLNLLETAQKLEAAGASRLIYTDISRDGTLKGPNLKNLKKLARAVKIPIIASGGVANFKDIQKVSRLAPLGVEAVIVGKALYTGKIDLKTLLKNP